MDYALFFQILSPLLAAVLTAYFAERLRLKPRVIILIGHLSNHTLNGNPSIYTHSVVIRNTGKKSATNVSLSHNRSITAHYDIYPNTTQYEAKELPQGGTDLIFPRLVPGEQVTVSYVYTTPYQLTDFYGACKHDDGFAKFITTIPIPQLPKWQIWLYNIFAFIGLTFIIYLVTKGLIAFYPILLSNF